jgi:UPF0755 protein
MDLATEENLNTEFPVSKRKILTTKKSYFIIIFVLLFLVFFYWFFFSAPSKFLKGIIVNIKQGESLRDLSFDLKEKKIIRSRISFEAFIILYGDEKHITIGDYLFENKLPVFKIARRIVARDRRLASVKITIPEGFDKLEIAELVSQRLKNFDKNNFLLKAKEGYLFPDTYFFFSYDTEESVLEYLNKNFEKKIKSLESEILASEKTKGEIIVLASLIEREAKGDLDREYISGILWNRLKKEMPLQVDAALETYKTKGLPEEPICNPGLESVRAALQPISSNYLYYLHDENGEIHYAKTFEEHKKNKLKYLK